MKQQRATTMRAVVLAMSAAVTLSVGCQGLLGIEDWTAKVSADGGKACLLKTDCPGLEVCLFKTCSPPCKGDADCTDGKWCLVSAAGNACVSASQAKCSGSACPAGTTCASGECRTECTTSASVCVGGQRCGGGVCVSALPDAGSDASASGGASGGGGSAGAAPDASEGSGGTAGASGAGGSGGRTEDGSTGTGDGGGCVNGTQRCTLGQPEKCQAGSWVALAACDTATPNCYEGACLACPPLTHRCTGSTLQECSTAGSWEDETTCADPTPTCNAQTGICSAIRLVGGFATLGSAPGTASIHLSGGELLLQRRTCNAGTTVCVQGGFLP